MREGGRRSGSYLQCTGAQTYSQLTPELHLAQVSQLTPGALLWAWEADAEYDEQAGEQWMVLHPDKYNRQVQYAWRY